MIVALAPLAGVASQPVVLVFGDSLSAAYGIREAEGWVALLAQRIHAQGYPYEVVNGSVSGETSHGGLTRLPALLARHHPAIAIVELGANDGLRGLDLGEMQANLREMIRLTQASGARVLLLGMHLPPNYGPVYTARFHASFGAVAEQTGAALVPFMLAGVATERALMQADGLHPAAAAQPRILENVWPILAPLLEALRHRASAGP